MLACVGWTAYPSALKTVAPHRRQSCVLFFFFHRFVNASFLLTHRTRLLGA